MIFVFLAEITMQTRGQIIWSGWLCCSLGYSWFMWSLCILFIVVSSWEYCTGCPSFAGKATRINHCQTTICNVPFQGQGMVAMLCFKRFRFSDQMSIKIIYLLFHKKYRCCCWKGNDYLGLWHLPKLLVNDGTLDYAPSTFYIWRWS